MKFVWLLLLSAACAVSAMKVDQGERSVAVSGVATPISRCEIVVPERTELLNFAAKELQYYLEKLTGQKIDIRPEPSSPDVFALILGDNAYVRQSGIDVAKLPQQGYVIQRRGNRLYLAGRDSRTDAPAQNRWGQCYRRGTLSAVYDFLERFGNVRFYFPGEIGTVVPEAGSFALPADIAILERPDFIDRRFLHYDGKWYEDPASYHGVKGINMNLLQLRMSEEYIPFGHGLAYMNYMKRFKDHPEYFALMTDGKRCNDPSITHTGHLCFNSPIREEIYQDAKAYLTGKPAAERGCSNWNFNAARPGYFSLMTQDWLYWCGCAECRKISPPGREEAYRNHSQAVSDFMWRFTAGIARRLTREKVSGTITQMAYMPYDRVPRCELPENIAVQVAVTGPGVPEDKQRSDDARIRAWHNKLKRGISLWTYPGKFGKKALPGIPAMMPRAIGHYFKERAPYLCGAFMESETDYYLFNYLNYYIFAKTTWDASTDVEKTLDEHFVRMFGPGAPMMKTFYTELERLWCEKIIRNTVDTALGPVTTPPNDFEIWRNIYSQERLKSFSALFDQAERAAAKSSSALKRIRFMRQNLFAPLRKAAERFSSSQQALDSWRAPLPGSVFLRPCKGERNEVATRVDLAETPDVFQFTFDCEEPRMSDLQARAVRRDDPKTFEDSCVEILLNPSGDRQNYFHFIANGNGALADYRCKVNHPADIRFATGARAEAARTEQGYRVCITVPKKDLGKIAAEFPVNFARHRALRGAQPKEIYYQWSPLAGGNFHALERFGLLSRRNASHNNLISDGSFDVVRRSQYAAGKWLVWQSGGTQKGQNTEFDTKVFISQGKSLHLSNTAGNRMSTCQYLEGMKPDARYRLSYFIKTDKLAGSQGAGAFLAFSGRSGRAFPMTRILGTQPWHRVSFEFTSPADTGSDRKPVLGLWIWNAAGDAWFDEVRLEELPAVGK